MDAVDDKRMTTKRTGRTVGAILARGGGVAAWRQIADRIEAQISSGEIAPGAQLATEAVLSGRFDVNRHTVRRALASLSERGLLRATRGRGTFVEPRPLAYPIASRTRFSEIVSRSGREPGGLLLSSGEEPANAAVAVALAVETGSPVLRLDTLRSADGVPVSCATAHVPLPRFAGMEAVFGDGASAAFSRYGVPDYRRATTRITARIAEAEVALRLDLAPGRPVMVVDSVNVDPAGVPVQATMAYFAADRVEIVVDT